MTAVTDLHPCGGLRVLDGMAFPWGDLRNSFSFFFLDGDVNRASHPYLPHKARALPGRTTKWRFGFI